MWRPRRDLVSFQFVLQGREGFLDQMMTIHFRGKTTAAPVFRYRALDTEGRPLPEVMVHSCYGSDRAAMALTYGENVDLLCLRGPGAHLAADVAAEVVELRPLNRAQNPIALVVQHSADGTELPSGGGFHHVTVVNQAPVEALCRVVAIALDAPVSGPQGAVEVVHLTPNPVLVPPSTQVRVDPPADAYATIREYFGSAFVTVKTYPAPA